MPNKPVALVTGANQGIGLQIAKELVPHGFTVLVGSRNFERVRRPQKASAQMPMPCSSMLLIINPSRPRRRVSARSWSPRRAGQNAAISNTNKKPGQSVEEYAKSTRPSVVSLDEMRAVWDTNVFGVLAVYQAMLPLLRATPGARIVHVSSGVGSLTRNSNLGFAYRSIFGPVYPASKTALNALTVAMAIELEEEGIKVNAVTPGYTKTNLNGYSGTETVEQGAREAVRVALLGPDGPTGKFSN